VTDVDFAAEGLLDGLEGTARDARLALLRDLHADGVPLDELHAATREGRLVLLPAERAIGGVPRYSAREIAELTGLDPEFIAELRRANGLPAFELDDRHLTERDLDSLRTAGTIIELGVPAQDMIDITRILGRGMGQAAEAMRTQVLKLVLEPGASEYELATRYADAARVLHPMLGPMLEQMINLHLRHVVRTEVISAAEREAGRLPGAREIAVCFADLVGFTRLGEELPADELGRVADRLGELASEHVDEPVRLVKTIGDAVMLVSPEVPPLLDAALTLVEAADAEGNDYPQLRVGVAVGEALGRAGDWYGRPVNLASRVTAIARPGSVLATREVRDAAPDAFAWSSAGGRSLKGVPGTVRLYRPRRLEQPPSVRPPADGH
jgi:adenylate cyclase